MPEGKQSCKTKPYNYVSSEMPVHELGLSYHWSSVDWRLFHSIKDRLITSESSQSSSQSNSVELSSCSINPGDHDFEYQVRLTSTVGTVRPIKPTIICKVQQSVALSYSSRLTVRESSRFSNDLMCNVSDRGLAFGAATSASLNAEAVNRPAFKPATRPREKCNADVVQSSTQDNTVLVFQPVASQSHAVTEPSHINHSSVWPSKHCSNQLSQINSRPKAST